MRIEVQKTHYLRKFDIYSTIKKFDNFHYSLSLTYSTIKISRRLIHDR